MITKIRIKNYKSFRDSTIEFRDGLNIVVGDNDAGKSTLLEAICLATTGRLNGRYLYSNLSSHIINQDEIREYLSRVKQGSNPTLPAMFIEIYLKSTNETADMRGTANSYKEDSAGLRFEVSFDLAYAKEYQQFIENSSDISSLPIEYYSVQWKGFNGGSRTATRLNVSVSLVDASRIRLQNGADFYLQRIIADGLSDAQRIQLVRAYRDQMQGFQDHEEIASINEMVNAKKGNLTSRSLRLGIDTSEANGWETAVSPFYDDLPVQYSGSGEQNMLKIMLAVARRIDDSHVVLVEEPENHLSYSSLNHLVARIAKECAGKQVIVTTHSSFVVNKLGLDQLMLLSSQAVTRLSQLQPSTIDYFKKLPGYDTLRLVLAKRVILVEGPSDELLVQRAYRDIHGHRAIEDGVDVISLQGLSFERFLEVARLLGRKTAVVTDNDGQPGKVEEKYAPYKGDAHISIYYSDDATLRTLETQIVAANQVSQIAEIIGRPELVERDKLVAYMTRAANKSECALRIHDSIETIRMPDYIQRAVNGQ